ncbi:hypothetical protein ACFFRE_12255 [Aciditerrimonas ferrireducens]|uniref:Uncharacterized protein n=1 Tax=Aciditerrimonas ferrireducens TaxID=667306 RepID=A0ABV6C9I7_9ACTN
MRTLAILFGLAVVALLSIMAAAGSPGALGILLTLVGIVAMIVLGTRLGGRGTPRRDPIPVPRGPTQASEPQDHPVPPGSAAPAAEAGPEGAPEGP